MKSQVVQLIPQDILLLLKIISENNPAWQQKLMAEALGLSQSEISESVARSKFVSRSINQAYENNFKKDLVGSLAPFILSLFICIITVLVSIISVFKKSNKRAYLPGRSCLLFLFLVLLQIMHILSYPDFKATLSSGFIPLLVQFIFGMSAVGFL
ncbi:MAG: hypothetical protein ACNS62_10070 [Candidatus Cyclobacteriaceae bacterium M3_2C_046]